MVTAVVEPKLDSTNNDDDDIGHYFCECSPNIALCGEDVSNQPVDESSALMPENACKKCVKLLRVHCILCGMI